MQIAASMAWVDGQIAPAEVNTILSRLCTTFAQDEAHELQLKQVLPNLLLRHIPIETLTPKLTTVEAKEMAVRVCYEVMQADANVIVPEKQIYQQLLTLLELPPERVQDLEANLKSDLQPL